MKRISLRLPDDVHEQVQEAAGDDRRSLNAEIIRLIEQGLKRQKERR